MRIDFYTFGGKTTWEDVFFYNQWRIQRHCNFKDYRLLDDFDICRCSGTFAECQKSFVEFVEAYEMERQNLNITILLHGLNGSRHDYNNMWRIFKAEGISATAVNYPSTKKNIDAHVRQLNVLLNNLSDAVNISFVSKGTGGLILRRLLCPTNNAEWKNRIKIKRIIQICPPNQGSKLFSYIKNSSLCRWFFGPMLMDGSKDKVSLLADFPKNVDLGIISCDSYFKRFAFLLPKKFKDLIPGQMENAINGPYKSIYIQNKEFNALNNEKVITACKSFIKHGNFNS